MAKRIESPSSINTFKQCKRKYYYQYIEKLPVLPNIHQVRGNIAHSTLENFYDIDVTEFNEENYPQKFREAIQRLFLHYWHSYEEKLRSLKLNKDQECFYFEETMLMLMNWINHFLEDITTLIHKKNISLQEAFEQIKPLREQQYNSENYAIKGFIDAVHQVDDEIHLLDYKTNSTFEVKDSIKLQLAIYALLYHEKHGVLPAKAGVFFLRHKLKIIPVDEELIKLAKLEIEIIHAHTSLTESISDYTKSISPLCKWTSGKCDFYDVCKPHQR